MERDFLEAKLAEGLSLERIGELAGKHPSTVAYWLKKYGLEANYRARHAPEQRVDPAVIADLVGRGWSIRQITRETGFGYSTVRFWIKRLRIETPRMRLRRETAAAREAGERQPTMTCPKHGPQRFDLRPAGDYRCSKCSSERVTRRRRYLKRRLVEEAGGCCFLCGYSRHVSALHFHHTNPAEKLWSISQNGASRSAAAVRSEARKCVLLCANCHAEVEAGYVSIPTPASLEFRGEPLPK